MGAYPIAEIRNSKLYICQEYLNSVLDKVGNRPVAVISVNGPMRSGKSYIINHFLRFLTSAPPNDDWFTKKLDAEFFWKNSADRQTTGILLWQEPLILQRDGRDIAILLMDTQGSFDDKTTTIENSFIFAFSCLMSSILIYNFKNQLSEDTLQFLQMFLGYAKMVTDQDEDSEAFSKLIFLIRDWQCPGDFQFGFYDDDHSPGGGRNYKKEKLDVTSDMVPEVRVVRREILNSFRNVACCLMPYPGSELAYYDKSDRADIMFVKAVQDFVPRIFDGASLISKKIGGQEVLGVQLKKLIETWAELFASADIPPVQNVAEATAEVQNAMAHSVALKCYQDEMKQLVQQADGLNDDALQQQHDTKKQEAIAVFQRIKRLKHEKVQNRYLELLQADIQRELGAFVEMNSVKRKFRELKITNEQEKQNMREEMERRVQEIRRSSRRRGGCAVM